MSVDEFEDVASRFFPMRWLERGDVLVIVSQIGPSFTASWGFTIWRKGECLGGSKDFHWTSEDATAQADLALDQLIAPGPSDVGTIALDELVPAARKVLDYIRSIGGFMPEIEMPLTKALAKIHEASQRAGASAAARCDA